MTVAALTSSIAYLENGVTLDFPAPFRFLSNSLAVSRVELDGSIATLAEGSDYSVSGGGTDAGGTVTLAASISGATLRIKRETPRAQVIDYTTGDRFPAETHEAGLDRAMLVDQEQDDKIADTALRALMVPDGETVSPIPASGDRAGRFLGFDGAGSPITLSGTGNDAALRTDLASVLAGAALVNFIQAGGVSRTLLDKARERVTLADFGVSAVTSASFNRLAGQVALDAGFMRLEMPNYTIPIDAQLELKFSNQRITGAGPSSKLVKSNPSINRLIYADGLSNVGIADIALDGMRSQTTNYVASRWCVFFRSCVRPFVRNCNVVGAMTDNIVFELCLDPEATNTISNDSNKGGFYWSACDGGYVIACTADGNGATADNVGSGFVISCTWGLSLTAIKAKNNVGGQMILSRGNKGIHVNGAVLGDELQTRGMFGLYAIGERTSGTVHGVVYDGVVDGSGNFISGTFYGTEASSFTNVVGYLSTQLDYVSDIDLINHRVKNGNATNPHGVSLLKADKVRIRGGRLVVTQASGVGVALSNNGAGGTTPYPTLIVVEAVDFVITSGNRINKYEALSTYVERLSLVDGVPLGNAAIADLPTSATTGVLPATTGAMVFANAATPTNAELLKYGLELESKLESTLNRLRLAGIILP